MDVTPLVKAGSQIIQSYSGGMFKISGIAYDGPVLVLPAQTIEWDVQSNLDRLKASDFDVLKSDPPDVVLLGCGARMRFLPPELKKALSDYPFSLDIMDTGAACRTYNVLMAEGRRVAAALYPSA